MAHAGRLQPPLEQRAVLRADVALEIHPEDVASRGRDDRLCDVETDRFLARPAEDRLRLAVPTGDPPRAVEADDRVVSAVEDLAHPVTAAAELRLGMLALQLRRGAPGEDLQKRRRESRVLDWLPMEHGDEADRLAAGAEEGDADVPLDLHGGEELTRRIERDDARGYRNEPAGEDVGAWRARDIVLRVDDELGGARVRDHPDAVGRPRG
jgi:hypothetical protein